MYIKTIRKYCHSEKTTHTYFRLSESYRDEYRIARQRMVLGLGRLLELPDIDQKVLFLERLNELIKCKPTLFSCKQEKVEQLAQHFYAQLKHKKKIDLASDIIAKRSRSKEKRSDCKLIVLAVIINTVGFLKYSDIFEGNTSDCTTLKMVITKLNQQAGYSSEKPIIVMDAGIATEANILFLKQEKYDYLCVSRSNPKDYKADTGSCTVQIYDKKNQPIELLNVRVENHTDNYLWVSDCYGWITAMWVKRNVLCLTELQAQKN